MNKVILLGRLSKDVETRYTQSTNTMVCTFPLAVNRRFAKEGGERTADFINIVAYSKTAEFVNKYFAKGQQVAICGRLQIRNYEDDKKQKHYVTEVVAEEAYFADSKKDFNQMVSELNSLTPVSSNEQSGEIMGDDDLPF